MQRYRDKKIRVRNGVLTNFDDFNPRDIFKPYNWIS